MVPVLAEADGVEDPLVDGLRAGVGDDSGGAVDDVVLGRPRCHGGRRRRPAARRARRRRPPATSGSSTARASRPGAAGRPAYATTSPPWVVSPGPAAWRAISITTSWARAPEAKRATVSTPRSPASRAARWTSAGHSGRGTSTHGVGASVSQHATALHCPSSGTALAIRRSRARSAATTSTEPQPLRGPVSVDSGTTVGSMPATSSMPCSASRARRRSRRPAPASGRGGGGRGGGAAGCCGVGLTVAGAPSALGASGRRAGSAAPADGAGATASRG